MKIYCSFLDLPKNKSFTLYGSHGDISPIQRNSTPGIPQHKIYGRSCDEVSALREQETQHSSLIFFIGTISGRDAGAVAAFAAPELSAFPVGGMIGSELPLLLAGETIGSFP